MSEQSLVDSFGGSLTEDVLNIAREYAEISLDAILDDGFLKEIPFLSTVVSMYRIGNNFRERHNMKKLAVFLTEINNNIVDETMRQYYMEKFESDQRFRNQELEYILILIDRYINFKKPQMLAKLYLAYLDEKIVWEEFVMYAEVIDRLLLLDYTTFLTNAERYIVHRNIGCESILRLVALGLLTETMDTSTFKEKNDGKLYPTWGSYMQPAPVDKLYVRTEFGEKLAEILR